MAAIQLNFTLRTSAHCKTVHLLGSWDNYSGQLPLSKDTNKAGGWKGTFRFQGQTLKQGQRYWYYYIIDGYHVSHDPARDSVVELTTSRRLNVLDIPAGKSAEKQSSKSSSRHARRTSTGVPKGRPLDKSLIASPRPCKPQETQLIRTMQFEQQTLEQIALQFAATRIEESDEEDCDSDIDSDVPSLSSSRSSNVSSPSSSSSVSSYSSSSACSCERYGITRAGDRVKLDCGGSRCGYSDEECSSDDEAAHTYVRESTRRHGVIIRA